MTSAFKNAGVVFMIFLDAASGQQRGPAPDQQLANLPAHRISPNDLIALTVYDAPELTRTVRVGPDGLIDLPLLRGRVQASDLLPSELERSLTTALKSEQILVRPLVTVTVVQYNSRHVSVIGAVHKPVTFEVVGETKLMDALARAEGITNEAGPELLLTRSDREGVQHINVKDLLAGKEPALNVGLDGGEEIRVPEARKIYVVGNVRKPGAIPVRDNSELTILKVLAIVEGVTPYAQKQAWIYRAAEGQGPRQEIPVELNRILARKAPDLTLQPDDILYIPDNVNKRAALETAKNIALYGSGAVSAVIYAGIR